MNIFIPSSENGKVMIMRMTLAVPLYLDLSFVPKRQKGIPSVHWVFDEEIKLKDIYLIENSLLTLNVNTTKISLGNGSNLKELHF